MRYRLGERLTPLKQNESYGEDDIRVEVMTSGELERMPEQLPHKKVLLKYMDHIHYCKAETFGNCIIGTVSVPAVKNMPEKNLEFGFYITRDRILFAEDDGEYVRSILGRLEEITYGDDASAAVFFAGFLDFLIEGDSLFLQEYEDKLIAMEDSMMKKVQKNSYERIIKYRKDMLRMRAYFTQLEDVGEIFCANTNHMLSEAEFNLFSIFTNRVGRLNAHTEMLREYVIQIREMYQSQIDLEQNHTMNLLTIVTTIFLPLTLLVGWYGMNFINMPELGWRYGYLGIIVLSVVIVLAEIYFFKKKRLL